MRRMPGYPGFTNHPFPTCYVCGTGQRRRPTDLPSDICPMAPRPLRGPFRPTCQPRRDLGARWTAPAAGPSSTRVASYVLGRIAVQVDPAAAAERRVWRGRGAPASSQGRGPRPPTLYGPDGAEAGLGPRDLDRDRASDSPAPGGATSPGRLVRPVLVVRPSDGSCRPTRPPAGLRSPGTPWAMPARVGRGESPRWKGLCRNDSAK